MFARCKFSAQHFASYAGTREPPHQSLLIALNQPQIFSSACFENFLSPECRRWLPPKRAQNFAASAFRTLHAHLPYPSYQLLPFHLQVP